MLTAVERWQISGCEGAEEGYGRCVKLGPRLFAFSVLVLWLAATQHCRLENLPGLGFLKCTTDTATSSECEGDGCCAVESAAYKPSDDQQVAAPPAPLLVVLVVQEPRPDAPLGQACLETPTRLPPELPQCWQFISRTALPVRAPSLAS
jgi:hypothetical protein